jgi:hypothetical protein
MFGRNLSYNLDDKKRVLGIKKNTRLPNPLIRLYCPFSSGSDLHLY